MNLAIIGLDTSHSVEFARRIQAPDCPPDQRVPGMRVTGCLRFETPFQNAEGLDKRQRQLEAWGVRVTLDLEEALDGCEAILIEINDGAFHREYFERVAGRGKPVFLDKPLAASVEDGRAILRLQRQHGTRVWSGSSIPFCPEVAAAAARFSRVDRAAVFGALGRAPAGDSFVWYGVHTVEMLQRLMGRGARSVRAVETAVSLIAAVDYGGDREGVVEAIRGWGQYGGRVQGQAGETFLTLPFLCQTEHIYRDLLRQIKAFFEGAPEPVPLGDTFEGLAIMAAARRSIETGRRADVPGPDGGGN